MAAGPAEVTTSHSPATSVDWGFFIARPLRRHFGSTPWNYCFPLGRMFSSVSTPENNPKFTLVVSSKQSSRVRGHESLAALHGLSVGRLVAAHADVGNATRPAELAKLPGPGRIEELGDAQLSLTASEASGHARGPLSSSPREERRAVSGRQRPYSSKAA